MATNPVSVVVSTHRRVAITITGLDPDSQSAFEEIQRQTNSCMELCVGLLQSQNANIGRQIEFVRSMNRAVLIAGEALAEPAGPKP